MNLNFVRKIIICGFILTIGLINFACQSQEATETGGLPQAYKSFYDAVKSKNAEEIKKHLSKGSLGLAELAAQQQNKTLEKVLENGLTATTINDTLPKMRDERVKDNYGSIEVYNKRDNRWEDIPFIKEEGKWKMALGELFSGSFKSPGKSQATLEQANSNAAGNNMIPLNANIDGKLTNPASENSNVNVIVIDTNSNSSQKVEKPEMKSNRKKP